MDMHSTPSFFRHASHSGVAPNPQHTFDPQVWLGHAREALFDSDPGIRFEYNVEKDGSSVSLEWTATYEDGRDITCTCWLQPYRSNDITEPLGDMMHLLCTSYRVLKVGQKLGDQS